MKFIVLTESQFLICKTFAPFSFLKIKNSYFSLAYFQYYAKNTIIFISI